MSSVTILLPWVPWNAERSTAPFLCAFFVAEDHLAAVRHSRDQPILDRGLKQAKQLNQFAVLQKLACSRSDAPNESAIRGNLAFKCQVFVAMVAKRRKPCLVQERPDRRSPGAERAARHVFNHDVEMGLTISLVAENDVT